MHTRDFSRFRPAAARKAVLRVERRMERVRRVVAFMEAAVGRGWAWRMEHRDHVMCEDAPKAWLVDRKRPRESSLRKLEQYAVRFGYSLPEAFRPVVRRDVAESLSLWNQTQN
jgi:hypothetical protein